MRNIRCILVALCLACIVHLPVSGQHGWKSASSISQESSKGILDNFLDENPRAIELNILSEGTKAYLCADDDNLFVRISVENPQLFMRMLMQGLNVRIDPTGEKKSKYSILFPSARDVRGNIPRQSSSRSGRRPDLGPILSEMNKLGAVYTIRGKTQAIESSRTLIELDMENEELNFMVLVPKDQMMADSRLSSTWSIGLYLESAEGVLEGPQEDRSSAPSRSRQISGRPTKPSDDKATEQFMKGKINVWETFSIDEVNDINNK